STGGCFGFVELSTVSSRNGLPPTSMTRQVPLERSEVCVSPTSELNDVVTTRPKRPKAHSVMSVVEVRKAKPFGSELPLELPKLYCLSPRASVICLSASGERPGAACGALPAGGVSPSTIVLDVPSATGAPPGAAALRGGPD